MEIESDHQTQSTGISMTEEKKPASKACNEQDNDNDKDEDDSDSDSGSMTCPLFMEGLPRNFVTNPQLAAIASLLDDEVREETKENRADVENDSTHGQKNDKNKIHSHPSHAPSTQTTTAAATASRHINSSRKGRTRRHRIKASPYPRPQDRTNEKQAKKTSVGEITLFMNMWQP